MARPSARASTTTTTTTTANTTTATAHPTPRLGRNVVSHAHHARNKTSATSSSSLALHRDSDDHNDANDSHESEEEERTRDAGRPHQPAIASRHRDAPPPPESHRESSEFSHRREAQARRPSSSSSRHRVSPREASISTDSLGTTPSRARTALRPSTSPATSSPHAPPFSPRDYFTFAPSGSTTSNSARPTTSPGLALSSPLASPGDPFRSPPIGRRQPASRSAHGITTAFGPPPALSTQRSYDRWRRAGDLATPTVPPVPSPRAAPPDPHGPEQVGLLTFQALEKLDAAVQQSSGIPAAPPRCNSSDAVPPRPRAQSELHATRKSKDLRTEEYPDPDKREPGASDDDMDASNSQIPTFTPQRRSLLGGLRPRSNSKRLSAHLPAETVAAAAHEGQSQSSHEDLFLDLAKGEDYSTSANGTEERTVQERPRPSRLAVASHRQSLSHGGMLQSEDPAKSSPLVDARRRSLQRGAAERPPASPTGATRSSTLKTRPYAASAHPLDSPRTTLRFGERGTPPMAARPKADAEPELPSRRQSVTENFSRPYRPSYLQHMTNGNSYSSPMTARTAGPPGEAERSPRHEGTESTVSTTAPSTVWDELDDLKSRIRKLEITGKLPSGTSGALTSSGALGGSAERPRTATTTVTTLSSSPKRAHAPSASPTDPPAPSEDVVQPLLRSALGKAQAGVAGPVFRALDTCAQDAIGLAALNGSGAPQTALERSLRRKADSLCRSLTELCIALAEQQPREMTSPGIAMSAERRPFELTGSSRPGSRSGPANTAGTLRRPDLTVDTDARFARAQSLDPEPTSARVLSRLEARRSSVAGRGGSGAGSEWLTSSRDTSSSRHRDIPRDRDRDTRDASDASSREASHSRDRDARRTSPVRDPATPTQSTLGRANTITRTVRREEPHDADRTVRPLSRARTDAGWASAQQTAGANAAGATKRFSREYTSQYPLPASTPRSEARRSYLGTVRRDSDRERERERERDGDREDDTLTGPTAGPTTPSTTIGPDPLAERRRVARDADRDRPQDRTVRAPQQDRTKRLSGANWEERLAAWRDGTGRESSTEGSERAPAHEPRTMTAAASSSSALERAHKRLSGSYGAYASSRLGGRMAGGVRVVPGSGE